MARISKFPNEVSTAVAERESHLYDHLSSLRKTVLICILDDTVCVVCVHPLVCKLHCTAPQTSNIASQVLTAVFSSSFLFFFFFSLSFFFFFFLHTSRGISARISCVSGFPVFSIVHYYNRFWLFSFVSRCLRHRSTIRDDDTV